jgi:uncharacterized protein
MSGMMTDRLNTRTALEHLHARRADILRLAREHGASNVRVFGSVARGEANADSDIDFLVEFQPGTSVWDVIGLWQDLSALLGSHVSVVTESTLEGRFRQSVLKDAVPL